MDQFFSQWGPASSFFWVRGLWALGVLLAFIWAAGAGRRAAARAMQRTGAHPNAILFIARMAEYGVFFAGIIFTLAILGVQVTALAAVVGLGSVALSLSLQDIGRNFIAGIYLLIERPFEVGDTIEVGGQQGMIEDVGLRTTILRRENDRVIIPNLVMFTSTVIQKKNQSSP